MSIVSRGKGGSAVGRSAYQRCAQSGGGEFDYSNKTEEFIHSEVMLPPGAPEEFGDPDLLWEAAEYAENRVDAQLARKLDIAIPDEVPEHLWKNFARELMQFYVDHGFAVEFSIHCADSMFRNAKNNHIHGMVSMRETTSDGFAKLKNRDFNKTMRKEGGHYMRRMGAETMNAFFERHGISAHVTHEKKEDRDAIVPEMPKHIIKEIARHKEDLAAHVAAGGKKADFTNQLSPAAERYARNHVAHRDAVRQRDKAILEVHENSHQKVWDAAHDAGWNGGDEYLPSFRSG